tara:strand:+ start:3641 stop:4477 length:837 start_codon:yes stop_codon:yes gene_type:complete
MKKDIIKAYAKINLSLSIFGKNKNNFHKIQSVISFLDLHDIIRINHTNKKNHTVKFFGPFSNNLNKNSILRLLNILDKKKLLKKKYNIQITKNIPQRSGLGGGSMDAASLLSYFFKKKLLITKKEVLNISNQIGSDVFIGLDRKNSILVNNKTIKRYKAKMRLFTVLIKPNIGCSTKEIYRKVRSYSTRKVKISEHIFKIEKLKKMQNDLELPAFKRYPILKKLKISLSKIDQVKFVRMTGSGSTIVAYFSNKKSAINALKLIKRNFKNYWSILSKTI